MKDLVTFLRARLDEDEQAARSASPGPWSYGDIKSVAGGSLYDPDVMIGAVHWDPAGEGPPVRRTRPESEADANGRHMARWDPARVLSEVEAKRMLIDMWQPGFHNSDELEAHIGDWTSCSDSCPNDIGQYTLRVMALPYREHPDWREEWAPQT